MLALIAFLPLVGFIINGSRAALIRAEKPSATQSGILASLMIFLSFLVSLFSFIQLTGMSPETRFLEQHLFSWIHVGNLNIDMALRLDPLSSLFTLVITGIGFLIHVYSIGYMGHDPRPEKFFAYLNLFCFAMLMLVLGASLPILFLGWEGVGLCSYLLIGFWYQDKEKAKAGKKAFVVNRVGDLGFLLGMFLLFWTYGSLDFQTLKQVIPNTQVSSDMITWICLLLFVGCAGKSAQIPLYVWLPDAMAGPTPVSALIHAATMVTSGIYMLTRLNFLYHLSPEALHGIATVGALTAFFAATIALVQKDIKKVLAYSTVSQLGYMFLACGVGAFSAAVFHVITHAFFKALLFLGAGSVIHGMHEEQNIFKMGGLKAKMPQTYLFFTIAWLAISGIPPFSGFFSKDEILWETFKEGSLVLWALGMMTAAFTAFYMTRLYYLTFLGKSRFDEHHVHVHESPMTMIFPLGALALLSAVGGFLSLPHFSWLEHWLSPVLHSMAFHGEVLKEEDPFSLLEWMSMGISVLGASSGIGVAFLSYRSLDVSDDNKKTGIGRVLEEKWYIDEIYEALIVQPIQKLSRFLWKTIDSLLIDGAVIGVGKSTEWMGERFRMLQTGSLQVYLFVMLLGLIAGAGYLLYG